MQSVECLRLRWTADDIAARMGPMLPDGTYDAFVVDAAVLATSDGTGSAMNLELTIIAGEHKGEVVALQAEGLAGTELDLLGMPATLDVTEGVPRVTIDG